MFPSALNATLLFSAIVSDAKGSRSGSASTTVHVKGTNIPVVKIIKFDPLPNPNAKFAILAEVTTKIPGRAVWAIDKASVTAFEYVLSPMSRNVSVSDLDLSDGIKSFRFNFVMSSNSLNPREDYTFSLTYFDTLQNNLASSSVIVSPNSPPAPGVLDVSPSFGTALKTNFECVAPFWTDDDLPIQYEFSILVGRDFSVVRSFSETLSMRSTFPPGDPAIGNMLTIRVAVADYFLAQSYLDTSVTVAVDEPVSLESLQTVSISALLNSSAIDADRLTWALSASVGVLNQINCSEARDCPSKNRKGCFDVSNTCGPCLEGFTGISGSSNTECIQTLDANITAFSQMEVQCPSGCSGHGRCAWIARNYIGELAPQLDECVVADQVCKATCLCHDGYAGSACSMTTGELSARQQLRKELLRLLSSLIAQSDLSIVALPSWINFLKLTIMQPSELSNDDKFVTANIVEGLLVWAGSNRLSTEYVKDIVDIMGALSWSNDCIFNSTLRSHEEWIDAFGPSITAHLANQTALLQLYMDSILSNVLVAKEVEFSDTNAFRSTFTFVDVLSDGPIFGPQSMLDAVISRPPAVFKFSSSQSNNISNMEFSRTRAKLLATSESNSSEIGAWLVQTKAEVLLNPLLLGDSIQAHFTRDPCASTSSADCSVLVTLPFSSRNLDISTNDEAIPREFVEITCLLLNPSNVSKMCGNGLNVTIECNGSWAGLVVYPCPEVVASPVCNRLSGRDDVDAGCRVVAFSNSNVTCRCPALYPSNMHRGREVSSTSSPQFVPMLTYTMVQFAATWSTADDMNANKVQESTLAFMLLSTVALCGLSLGFLGFALDRKEQSKESSGSSATGEVYPARSDGNSMGDLKNIVLNSLPSVFMERAWLVQFIAEMKKNHKWLSVVFSYSEIVPRHVRALTLTGYVLFVMFGNAMMFQLTLPDDDSCQRHASEATCLAEMSGLTKENKCFWDEETETCLFRTIQSSIWVVMYIAIISAVITLPLTLIQDYLVTKVILAPLRSFEASVARRPSQVKVSTGNDSSVAQATKSLYRELSSYRSVLTTESKLELDRMWGDLRSLESNPPRALITDLRDAAASALKEERYISQLGSVASREAKMLSLFQRDLLPFTAGTIVQSKVAREVEAPPESVLMVSKVMAWAYLILSNLGILFYIYLFAIQQSDERQRHWLAAFVVWVATDMILISTTLTYLTCVYVPSLFIQDVKDARNLLLQTLDLQVDFTKKTPLSFQFNACVYFFISHRVAASHPELQSSKIILQYTSPWPRRSYWSSFSPRSAIAFALIRFLEALFDMPSALQDMIARFMVTLFAANVVLTESELDQFGPVVHFLFVLAMLVAMYIFSKLIQYLLRATMDQEMRSRSITVLEQDASSLSVLTKQNILVDPMPGRDVVLPRRRQSAVKGLEAAERLEQVVRAAELRSASEDTNTSEKRFHSHSEDGDLPFDMMTVTSDSSSESESESESESSVDASFTGDEFFGIVSSDSSSY
jgi:hypothetical protein